MKADKMKYLNKKGQEEMVGFALIVIIVAIILLFFVGFVLTNDSGTGIDSHEANSFVQSALQYTTTCKQNFNYLDVQDLIFSCVDEETCNSGENSCDVLNSTIKNILESSWNVGNESFYKAYEFEVNSEEGNLITFDEGSKTGTYKSALQTFAQSGDSVDILFRVYTE